jgi:hypothetical protein
MKTHGKKTDCPAWCGQEQARGSKSGHKGDKSHFVTKLLHKINVQKFQMVLIN